MAKKKEKVDIRTMKIAYRSIFSGAQGKIVREDLKDWCHVTKPSLVPNDPYMTAYNEGARGVFLRICAMANIDLDQIMGSTVSDNRK